MYRNFIFDLYGTLIDIRTDEDKPEFWSSFAEYLGENGIEYTPRGVHDMYNMEVKRLVEEPSQYQAPEIDIMKVFTIICRNKRPDMTYEEIWKVGEQFRILSTSMLKLYDNTLPVLDALKATDRKIYLLSNAQSVFTRQELDRMGLTPYFDDIFISSDEGCKKPDREFFMKLVNKHGLDIRESVMIGNDGASDIAGANSLGMDSLYIRTAISPAGEPLPQCRYAYEDGDIGHVLELIK